MDLYQLNNNIKKIDWKKVWELNKKHYCSILLDTKNKIVECNESDSAQVKGIYKISYISNGSQNDLYFGVSNGDTSTIKNRVSSHLRSIKKALGIQLKKNSKKTNGKSSEVSGKKIVEYFKDSTAVMIIVEFMTLDDYDAEGIRPLVESNLIKTYNCPINRESKKSSNTIPACIEEDFKQIAKDFASKNPKYKNINFN